MDMNMEALRSLYPGNLPHSDFASCSGYLQLILGVQNVEEAKDRMMLTGGLRCCGDGTQ